MKSLLNISLILLIILIINSCAGSKKMDFDSAYKFSRYNYARVSESANSPENSSVSMDKLNIFVGQSEILPESTSNVAQNLNGEMMVSTDHAGEVAEFVRQYKQLDRNVKKEIRKEIKEELRQMDNLEANTLLSVYDVNHASELEGNSRLAVFIGGGGLALLILGAIFSVGFLYIVGALAIVAGAVLFIIDQN